MNVVVLKLDRLIQWSSESTLVDHLRRAVRELVFNWF
jgi:hypothetical protein